MTAFGVKNAQLYPLKPNYWLRHWWDHQYFFSLYLWHCYYRDLVTLSRTTPSPPRVSRIIWMATYNSYHYKRVNGLLKSVFENATLIACLSVKASLIWMLWIQGILKILLIPSIIIPFFKLHMENFSLPGGNT